MSIQMFEDDESMMEAENRRMTRVLSRSDIDASFDNDEDDDNDTTLVDVDDQDTIPHDVTIDYEARIKGMTTEQVKELLEKLSLEENILDENDDVSGVEDEITIPNEPKLRTQKKTVVKGIKKKENPIQSKKAVKGNKKGDTANLTDFQNKNNDIMAPPTSPSKGVIKSKRGKNKKEKTITKVVNEDMLTPSVSEEINTKVIYEDSLDLPVPEEDIKAKKSKRGKKNDANNDLNSGDKNIEDVFDGKKQSKTKKGTRGKQHVSECSNVEVQETKPSQEVNSHGARNKAKKETSDSSISQAVNNIQNNKNNEKVVKSGRKINAESSDIKEAKSKFGKSATKNNRIDAEMEVAEVKVELPTQNNIVEVKATNERTGHATKKVISENVDEQKSEGNKGKAKNTSAKDVDDNDFEKLDKPNAKKKNNKNVLKEVNDSVDKPVESNIVSNETTKGRPKRNLKKEPVIENVDEVTLVNKKAQKPNTKSDTDNVKKAELIKSKAKIKKEKTSPQNENKSVIESELPKRATRKK